MIRKTVHYKVAPGFEGEALAIIKAFVTAIREREPHTTYVAYQTSDPRRFLHAMTFPDEAAEKTHQTAAYTTTFVSALYPNCEELPEFTDLTLVIST